MRKTLAERRRLDAYILWRTLTVSCRQVQILWCFVADDTLAIENTRKCEGHRGKFLTGRRWLGGFKCMKLLWTSPRWCRKTRKA